MKQVSLKVSSFCFAIAVLLCSLTTAFAEENGEAQQAADQILTINDEAKVNVGDVVTYTLYLSEAVEPIVGFELRLFYDTEYLEYEKSSLKFEKFDVVIYNEDIEGKIPMNCSNLSNLPSFEKKGQFVSANFKVKQGGNAGITYFFTELYGEDLQYLKSYKLTYDLSVGEKSILKDATPPVNSDESTLENNQGDFINYEDGMGENNSPNRDDSHVRVGTGVVNQVIDVTHATDGGGSGGFFGSTWFIVIAAVLVVCAVVTAVVIVSSRKKEN